MTIVIAYDGSPDAQAAIDCAGRVMAGADATVLSIWEPFLDSMERSGAIGAGLGFVPGYLDDDGKIDAANEQLALRRATEGAERATAAGLTAEPRIARRQGTIAREILAVSDDVDADVVVVGTRGLGGIRSLLLGSVSQAVVHHAGRAVLIVPSPTPAEPHDSVARMTDAAAGVA